ncbi:carboxymuconolactone decarboxylase family protein [Acidicapsa acidisoli]|uniref:carboxymuconolactone decarboxylase family protein n=1 Tax=Acidicapsa acidisoli TaxID=1615681 RepID=UPI0021E0352C|nr:peroxidase-related enzyme [Acidicapsa acidisoli]
MGDPEIDRNSQLSSPKPSSSSINLPVVEEDVASDEVAALYDHFRSHFGRPDVPGILKCFATHPLLLKHMMDLSGSLIFSDGHLTRRHKEMIATLVSSQNACAYCADSHSFALRVQGGSAEALCAIQRGDLLSPALTSAEQTLLSFVAKVNTRSHEITVADIEELHQAGWGDLEISEAIHVAALFATFNRVVNAFGLPSQGLLALYENSADPKDESIRSRTIRPTTS